MVFRMYSSAVSRVIYKNARTVMVMIEKRAMQKKKKAINEKIMCTRCSEYAQERVGLVWLK